VLSIPIHFLDYLVILVASALSRWFFSVVIASNSILSVVALNSNSLFFFLHLGVKPRVLLVASALSRWFFSVVIASNSILSVAALNCDFLVLLATRCQGGL
jgi:hypothetical protein